MSMDIWPSFALWASRLWREIWTAVREFCLLVHASASVLLVMNS